MLNKVILIGRLGNDISKHIKETPTGFIVSAQTMINNSKFLAGDVN